MTFFSEYIKSIITVGICAFLSESVCSHFSKNKATAKGIKFITNLCVFTVAISPVFSLFSGASLKNISLTQENQIASSDINFINLTEEELEKELTRQILLDTGILTEQISIQIECSNDEVDIKKIAVTVSEQSDIQKVKEYIINSIGKDSKAEITVNSNEQN